MNKFNVLVSFVKSGSLCDMCKNLIAFSSYLCRIKENSKGYTNFLAALYIELSVGQLCCGPALRFSVKY